MNPNDRLWQITLTQRQMCLMMNALEDWHRFLCGQCSMAYATSFIDSPKRMRLTRDLLANYPDDVEVVLFRQESEDYEEFYDTEIFVETNDDNQLVID